MATIRHKFNKSYFEGGAYFCGQFHVPGNIKLSNDLAVDGYQLTEIEQKIKHIVGLALSFVPLFSTSAIKPISASCEALNFLYQGKQCLSILSELFNHLSVAPGSPLAQRLDKLEDIGTLKFLSCVRSIGEFVMIYGLPLKIGTSLQGLVDLVTNGYELVDKPSIKKTLLVASNTFYLISLFYSERSRIMESKLLIASLICQSLYNFYIAIRTGTKIYGSTKHFYLRMNKALLHGLLGAVRLCQGYQCYQFFQQMEQQRRSQKAFILMHKPEDVSHVAAALERQRQDYGKNKVVFVVSEDPKTRELGQQLAEQLHGSVETETRLNEQSSPNGLDRKALRRLRESRARSFAEMVHSYPLDSETLTVILEDQLFMKNLRSVLSKLSKKGHVIESADLISSNFVVMTKDSSNKITVWDQFKVEK